MKMAMNVRWILLLGLLSSTLAFAFDTYRVGSRLIRTGDAVSTLVGLVGQPVYKEPIETSRGAFVGERWQYQLDRKSVTFTIKDGKIAAIEEVRK